jgi:hypothetical protein
MEEVGEEALIEARGAVFMLFYERVGEYEGERVPVVPAAPVPAPQQHSSQRYSNNAYSQPKDEARAADHSGG